MDTGESYLDLYDFRRHVFAMYRQRNQALQDGREPAVIHEEFRRARDELFGRHPQSALSPGCRERFDGLDYFPYNSTACVEASVDFDVDVTRLPVGTSGEQAMPMVRVARLRFSYEGMPAQLLMYWIDVYGGGLFVPFRDTTAPVETYGGGRYLLDTVKGSDFLWSLNVERDRRIVLDFNYAYNPSCAYNPRWVCPLAPRENWLSFPVRAGERRYEASTPVR